MKFIWLLSLATVSACNAQSLFPAVGPLYTTINAYSPTFADAFSVTANQALLPSLDTISIGVYGEQRFMLNELRVCTAAIAWPLQRAGVGLMVRYAGMPQCNTSTVGAGYGRQIGENISIGIQFNYVMLRIAGYGSVGVVDAEMGLLYRIARNLYGGLHVYNPVPGNGESSNDVTTVVFRAGLGYDASDKIFTSFEIEKQRGSPPGVNVGIQYIAGRRITGRLAIATATSCFSVGLGLQWKSLRTDIISSFHPQLGITPALMLLFCRKESKPDSL